MMRFIGFLLQVGFVGAYCWWIVAAVAVVAVVYYAPRMCQAHCARMAERQAVLDAIAARADQQHRWVLAADPRGTYGAAT